MAGIVVEAERCKGCGLCVEACPQHVLSIGKRINLHGQFYAVVTDPTHCIGCCSCGIVCPEAAIEVHAWGTVYQCFAY